MVMVSQNSRIDVSDGESVVRRLGEENEDMAIIVAIVIDSGADVALFPLRGRGITIQYKDPATRWSRK